MGNTAALAAYTKDRRYVHALFIMPVYYAWLSQQIALVTVQHVYYTYVLEGVELECMASRKLAMRNHTKHLEYAVKAEATHKVRLNFKYLNDNFQFLYYMAAGGLWSKRKVCPSFTT